MVFKHSPLLTVLSGSNLSIPLDLSRDFSDIPITLFLANIRLQCKQCAYRPSYRCQQLRRNYIKYTYTLLRQPVLLPIHAITGGQLLLYTPDKQPDRQTAHRQTDRLEHLIIPSPTDRIGVGNFIIIMQASILYSR